MSDFALLFVQLQKRMPNFQTVYLAEITISTKAAPWQYP